MIARWSRVNLEGFGYVLPEERISSSELESQLAPLYKRFHIPPGQLEVLTGIKERRVWPVNTAMSDCAARAGREALKNSGVHPQDIGAVIYGGVCRDNLEPATACAVAEALGISSSALLYDVSNACLGVMSGMIEIANRIELGQIRAGLVVSAESSRHIGDTTIKSLLAATSLDAFRLSLATLTGGSGAVGVVLTEKSYARSTHRLLGAAALNASAHHRICRWGPEHGLLGETPNVMVTDATQVLQHGVALGRQTWGRLLEAMEWRRDEVDKVICHQVGSQHRLKILESLGVSEGRDFCTFEYLGNMGTVALPITAAVADSQGFFAPGDRVGFLGIGSGLNCMMLGLEW